MKYKSFNKFITEKSAQSSAREFETFGNRASRSMARKHQECGQLSGDAKTACYYKQKDESYIVEQEARALGGKNSRKLKELEAAYSATGRGKTVASGPYEGKMRGELRSMINALKSGDTQKTKNIEAISSTDVGGGLQRDASGNVSVNQEKAKEQGDEFMQKTAETQGGTYNPETGQIEFGAKIPLISTGNFFSVGKDGKGQTNYGNIAQTVAQAGLMAIPGGAAIGGGIRGGAAAYRGIQGYRGARNISKAQRIMANSRGAGAAGASRSTVQGMQQVGRETMRKGMSQTATATRGQAVGQGRALATGAANTVRGMSRGANLGMAPSRAAFNGTRGLINLATRGAAPVSRVVGGGLRGTGNVVSTIMRNPLKATAIAAGADIAVNDGKITKDVVNKGAETLGFNAPFDQKPKTQSTPADRPPAPAKVDPQAGPPAPAKVDPQAGPPVIAQDPKPQPEMSTLADRPPATTATPNAGGSSNSTAPATTTAAVAATKFVPQEVPANATPEERQRIATANLQGSQKARNQRDFGTETPTETQIQKRSESSKSKTDARRANIASVMSDPNSAAMKKAQAEIDRVAKRNMSSGSYKNNRGGAQKGINDATAEKIRRKYAREAAASMGAGGAAGGGSSSANPNPRTTAGPGPAVRTDIAGNERDKDDNFVPQPVRKDKIDRPVDPTKPTEIGDNIAGGAAAVLSGDVNKMADSGMGINNALTNPGGTNFLGIPLPDKLRYGLDGTSSKLGYNSKGFIGGMFGANNSPEDEAQLRKRFRIRPDQLRQRDPNAPIVDPNAAPAAAKSNITRDQVDASGDLRRALGIQGVGQNVDDPGAIDKARNDVGAGSAAIKPGETASTARGRIMDEMGKQGKPYEEIKTELKRLGLLSASFGAGTTVSNQRTSGNQPRTVDQSRSEAEPTVPFQQ